MPTKILPESGRGRVARNNDVIQLYHPGTDSYLMTHDVASPLTTTNQEYTTWPKDDLSARYNDTKFRVVLNDGHEGEPLKTKSGWFQLVHESTGVSMQVGGALPDWGFKQQEINGQKNLPEKATTWFVEEILMDECTSSPSALPQRRRIAADRCL
jgi:dolichyl-phosphate-mannose-protein mannosyltransferase